MKSYRNVILAEVTAALSRIDDRRTEEFVAAFDPKRRIYITGVGRSGLIVKAFGQRLMHLGFQVHLADEISAPAIRRGDILLACSGTGTTQLTLYMARKARSVKAKVVSITTSPSSPLAKHSSLVLIIPVPLEPRRPRNGVTTCQPARSLFEQAMFLYLDSIILNLIGRLKITRRGIERRHANLE